MNVEPLSRRAFLLAGGAVVAGTLVGCGAGGAAPEFGLPNEGGDAVPTLALPEDPVFTALEEARASDPTLAFLTRHDFDRWQGETFDLTNPAAETTTVELVTVRDQSELVSEETREYGLREPFSVQFHGPLDAPHGAGRHRLTHPDMGDVLVHVQYEGTTEDHDEHGDRRIYELFFN